MAYIPAAPDRIDVGNSTTTPLVSLAVTGASYSGSSLVLTGAWGTGGANAYVGFYFNVTGFTGVATGNNQYAICTASAAGSITLTMTGGYNGIAGSPTAAQAFTGTAVDVTAASIATITVHCFTDQGSATGGMQVQWSQDNVNWGDHSQKDTAMAGMSCVISDKPRARYYRVVHINGTTSQGTFRLQTIQSVTNTSGTVRDMDTVVAPDDEAQLVRAVLAGRVLGADKFVDVITDPYGSLQTVIAGQAADAFGRVRAATPVSLFDAKFQYSTQPLLFVTGITGTGSVAKTANESSLTLSTGGTANNAAAINQTKQYFPYEPGKSQQIMLTGLLGAQVSNVRSEMGYFDANDGVFFRMDGWAPGTTSNSVQGMCIVQRTSTSGSVVDTVVPQSSWNFDKMDGTGVSGVTLDFSKTQIFVIDFQWLGVGRVRWGFFVNGTLLIVHQIYNANLILSPYMNTAHLPCRASIANAPSGSISGTNTMKQICMTVISEGGTDQPSAYQFSASNQGTTITSITTRKPLVSMRAKATFGGLVNRAYIELLDFDVYNNDTTTGGFWELVYNGTLSGGAGTFNSADTNSVVEYNIDRTGCASGTVIASGYAPPGKSNISFSPTARLPLALDIAGANPDVVTLCLTSLSSGIAAAGALRWKEIR